LRECKTTIILVSIVFICETGLAKITLSAMQNDLFVVGSISMVILGIMNGSMVIFDCEHQWSSPLSVLFVPHPHTVTGANLKFWQSCILGAWGQCIILSLSLSLSLSFCGEEIVSNILLLHSSLQDDQFGGCKHSLITLR
jgi:hypothetical protein